MTASDSETYQGVTATITLDKRLSTNGVKWNTKAAPILDGKSITFAATVTNTGTDGLTESGITVTDVNPTGSLSGGATSLTQGQSSSYSGIAQTASDGLSAYTATMDGTISDDFGDTATVTALDSVTYQGVTATIALDKWFFF